MRKVLVNLCVIFNGEYILLKKNNEFNIPSIELQSHTTGNSAIKKLLKDIISIDIVEDDKIKINQDHTLNPFFVNTRNNEIVLNYGISIEGDTTETNLDDIHYWVRFEDVSKISISDSDKTNISRYINIVRDSIEVSKL